MTLIQNAQYVFWQLDKLIKNELFWANKRKRQMGLPSSSAGTEADPYKRIYGTAVPASIPESTAWWKSNRRTCAQYATRPSSAS